MKKILALVLARRFLLWYSLWRWFCPVPPLWLLTWSAFPCPPRTSSVGTRMATTWRSC